MPLLTGMTESEAVETLEAKGSVTDCRGRDTVTDQIPAANAKITEYLEAVLYLESISRTRL
jgi:beta-lactam-binding protein with PASTA domain